MENSISTENIKELLSNKKITPSFHRIKIYKYLFDNRIHPTVDKIFSDLNEDIPTLSKTTVYNTLKTFTEKNLVSALTIEENEIRYDANINFHAHFKCKECQEVFDIFIKNPLENSAKMIDGHKILENQLYMKGICKNCLK